MQKCLIYMLILLFCIFSFVPGYGQEISKVMVDFPGVEFEVFLKWVGLRTGKRFIYEDDNQVLKKKVNIVSSEPIPEDAIFPLCLSVLEANGYTAVLVKGRHANVWKIIPLNKAISKPIPIVTKEELDKLDNEELFVSQLVLLRYINAQHVITAIQQAGLVSQQTGGSVATIQGTNALLITDTVVNVRRITGMIQRLDNEPVPTVTVYVRLRYATAENITSRVKQFFAEKRARDSQKFQAEENVAILADERTNTVILSGEKANVDEVRQIIETLDSEVREVIQRTMLKTYILENTTPNKILPTLTQLISAKVMEPAGNKAASSISVMSNDHANALVIYAPIEVYPQIENLIKELDIRRPQVLLEVAVIEFTPTNLLALGIELQTMDAISPTQSSRQFGATQFGLSSLVDKAGEPIEDGGIPDGKVPNVGSGFTAFLTKGKDTSIPILLRALQTVSMSEVHAVPRILTNDNEEAEITLEDEVPVIKTTVDEGTTVSSFQEFVKAGTKLKIKPHISKGNYLQLEVTQDIASFVGSSNLAGTPPPKTSRSIKATVTVPDGKTVILGGLTGRREVESIDQVPILGDIPILGYLFQSRSKNTSRTSLYVFITPRIINAADFKDLEEESKKSQKELKEFKDKFQINKPK